MKRDLIILGAAILFGIAAAVFYEMQLSGIKQEMQAQIKNTVPVCYLAKGLGTEQELSEELLEKRDVPESFMHPQTIQWKDRTKIYGQRLRLPLQGKQPLLWSDLAETSRRSISDTILPGRGVVSIPIDMTGGVSGLISPGARVDVYGIFKFESLRTLQQDTREKISEMESTVSGTPSLGDLAKSLDKIQDLATRGQMSKKDKDDALLFEVVPIARNLGVFAVGARTQMDTEGPAGQNKYSTISFDVDQPTQLVLIMAATAVSKGGGRLVCVLRSNEGAGDEDERPFQVHSSANLLNYISQSMSASK